MCCYSSLKGDDDLLVIGEMLYDVMLECPPAPPSIVISPFDADLFSQLFGGEKK